MQSLDKYEFNKHTMDLPYSAIKPTQLDLYFDYIGTNNYVVKSYDDSYIEFHISIEGK